MGTSVFHPQDCLIAPQRDRNLRLFGASECPSPVARPCRRSSSATPEALASFRDCRRNITPSIMRLGEYRKQILDQGLFLGRKAAAAGLLPAPPQVMQSAHASTLHRCPSVPQLDSSASACFPWNGTQVCGGRVGPSVNSLKGESWAGSWYRSAAASQKPNFYGNSHFSDVLKHGRCPRWTGIGDQKVEYRRRMQPEVARGQTHLCRKVFRPPVKVLPASEPDLICTNTAVSRRKHGMGKQILQRSASEKRQEVQESPPLQRPGTGESIKKLMANSSEGVLLCCNGNDPEVKPTRAASTADRKRAEYHGICHGRMGRTESVVPRLLLETVCQQIGGTERKVAPSLQTDGDGSLDAAMRYEENFKRDNILGAAGFVTQAGDVEKNSCLGHLEPSRIKQLAGSRLISRSLDSVIHNDRMWVSAMHDERWAGPSFFNSPSPSSLPVPSFTAKFSRSASTGSEAARNAAYVARTASNDGCFLKESRFQDVAVATNDLRRMLNLDHGSGDV